MKLTMPHMRMRSLLLLPLLLIPVALTTASLLIVRRNMQQELQQGLADDLLHSSSTFRNLERSRRGMLGREVILLADQPSLKALMTTQDPRTIENAAGEYARLSGSDLFALTSPTGSLLALYEGGEGAVRVEADPAISDALRNSSSSPFIYVHDKLYEIAAQPIYFGSRENGSVLGYLVVGSAIDHLLAQQVAQSVSGEVAFYSNHRIVSSSLSPVEDTALAKILAGSPLDDKLSTVTIGGGLYRLDRIQLSGDSAVSVEMILLKSMQALRAEETRLNHMTITLGIVAFIVGGLLALGVARLLTAPLEELGVTPAP